MKLWNYEEETGRDALECFVFKSGFASLCGALAAHTIFAHPKTVKQTRNDAVFPIVRGPNSKRGSIGQSEGLMVGYDDNSTPAETLLMAIGLDRRPKDTQINHIYARSTDVNCYSALPNLCLTPTFLAKLTDTDVLCKATLKRRSFDLYKWRPEGEDEPEKPEGFDDLIWAELASPIDDLATTMRTRIASQNNYRTRMYKKTGWMFGAEEID